MSEPNQALNVDLYELTMSQVYWQHGMEATATFSLFFRGYPPNRAFYLASGIDDALAYLGNLQFGEQDISHLKETAALSPQFLRYLKQVSFQGQVRAVREGSVVFADEPIIEVTAPLVQAQLVETMLLNIVTSASLFATKAARIAKAAGSRSVVDFGSRRAHSPEAGVTAARSSFIAGFDGTSNVEAAARFGIPAIGTMAHSFIQSFDNEIEAFETYASQFPDSTTLLVDTYDIEKGMLNAIEVGLKLRSRNKRLSAIRIDSGDLELWSERARKLLDDSGLNETRIVVSGGLDEFSIARLTASSTPIDIFGVGTRFATSADAPFIDSVYKLVELKGRPVFKTSEGKETLPWAKQVYRTIANGLMLRDVITKADSKPPSGPAEPMLRTVMRNGIRTCTPEPLEATREFVKEQLSMLPDVCQALTDPQKYPVETTSDISLNR